MLFAAGMGIGLMFWGVAEPMTYYSGSSGTPLGVEQETPQAADMAMAATMSALSAGLARMLRNPSFR